MLASIRNQGHCPCPRCLIPVERIPNVGMTLDMKQRKTLAREDNAARKHKVDLAREIIYEKKYAVNSKAVDAFLKAQSLVPTLVSTLVNIQGNGLINSTECIFKSTWPSGIGFIHDACY